MRNMEYIPFGKFIHIIRPRAYMFARSCLRDITTVVGN